MYTSEHPNKYEKNPEIPPWINKTFINNLNYSTGSDHKVLQVIVWLSNNDNFDGVSTKKTIQ